MEKLPDQWFPVATVMNCHTLDGSKQQTVLSPQLWKPSVHTNHQQVSIYHGGSSEGHTLSPPDFGWRCDPWVKAMSSQSLAL